MVLAESKSIGYPTTPSELVRASFRGATEPDDDVKFRSVVQVGAENGCDVVEAGIGRGSC